MHSGYLKAFFIPLTITIGIFTLQWLRNPFFYTGGQPKFAAPLSWTLTVSIVVGSFLGALIVLVYHLSRKRK